MTVNRTTLLDLPLPVTGTESGTWGDTTNNGLTQYLDIAIAGTLVLSTDADVTLTSTEGDSSATNIGATTAQYAILRWTATGSTTRNITALAQSKTYVVINATGGTQSIVLRGAGPTTGVTIISGEKALCVWNGSDFVKVSSSAAAGGSNTQVQYNSSGVLAGSSNLTFNGTSLTLGGNPTLSAGTANGVLYLNGSKVATSGSALTFDGTTLATQTSAGGSFLLGSTAVGTSSTITATNNNGNAYANLNYVALSHTWKYGSTTFASVDQNGTYIWYPLGTEGMRLTSTGLGIGTSSPSQKLTVVGNALVTPTGGWTTGGVATQYFGDVYGSIKYDYNTTNFLISSYGSFSIATNGTSPTTRLTVDSSGNLGLGVTPSAWGGGWTALQVGRSVLFTRPANDGTHLGWNLYVDGTDARYIASAASTQYRQYLGEHAWFTAPSGTAGNAITFTQAMTLDASGQLAIGRTSAWDSNAVLTLEKSGVASHIVNCTTNAVTLINVANGGALIAYTGTASNHPFAFYTNGNERARITSGGEVYIAGTTDQGAYNLQVNGTGVWGAGAYVNGSDERLKDNIQTLNDGLAVVSQLRPVTFQYKPEHSKDQSVQPGFIAQELQQAMDGKAYLDGVVQSGPEYLNVAYQNLIPILTKAIQEQQALIESLTTRVAQLEGA